jgi:nucleoside-diphosphate-sugar epimerase
MTTILVTGATGNVGRPPVTDLVDACVTVRAVARHRGSAGLPAAVQLVTAGADGLRRADAVSGY